MSKSQPTWQKDSKSPGLLGKKTTSHRTHSNMHTTSVHAQSSPLLANYLLKPTGDKQQAHNKNQVQFCFISIIITYTDHSNISISYNQTQIQTQRNQNPDTNPKDHLHRENKGLRTENRKAAQNRV